MILATALLALFFAAGLTALFIPALGMPQVLGQATSVSALIFGSIVFLHTLAAGLWVIPIGPQVYGAPMMPMLAMSMLSSFLLAALIPGRHAAGEVWMPAESRRYFWLLIFGLLTTVVVWCLV